jgi:hypothetical protein
MATTDPAVEAANERAKRYRDASEKIRERSDTAAKALAALGTAGLTAVGIKEFSDLFPMPPGEWWVGLLVGFGFVVMIGVLAAFTFFLWDANRPLVPRTDLKGMRKRHEIDRLEKKEMVRAHQEMADRHGAATLAEFEARGEGFERLAERETDPARAADLRARANRVRADTDVALAQGQLIVVRRRMNRALKGPRAVFLASAFVVGLLLFGIGADHIESKRSDEVAAYKACAEAVTAKVDEAQLPEICEGKYGPEADTPATDEQTQAAAVAGLGAQYTSCIDSAVEHERTFDMCDGIKTQLVAAAEAAP